MNSVFRISFMLHVPSCAPISYDRGVDRERATDLLLAHSYYYLSDVGLILLPFSAVSTFSSLSLSLSRSFSLCLAYFLLLLPFFCLLSPLQLAYISFIRIFLSFSFSLSVKKRLKLVFLLSISCIFCLPLCNISIKYV